MPHVHKWQGIEFETVCVFVFVDLKLQASIPKCATIWHIHSQHTHTDIIPSQFTAQWISRLCLQHKSNWRLSKALLSIFPLSVFFIVLSRYFPWWLACCRWEREKLHVWIMNSHLPSISLPNTLKTTAMLHLFFHYYCLSACLQQAWSWCFISEKVWFAGQQCSKADNSQIEIWFVIEKDEKLREEDKKTDKKRIGTD